MAEMTIATIAELMSKHTLERRNVKVCPEHIVKLPDNPKIPDSKAFVTMSVYVAQASDLIIIAHVWSTGDIRISIL